MFVSGGCLDSWACSKRFRIYRQPNLRARNVRDTYSGMPAVEQESAFWTIGEWYLKIRYQMLCTNSIQTRGALELTSMYLRSIGSWTFWSQTLSKALRVLLTKLLISISSRGRTRSALLRKLFQMNKKWRSAVGSPKASFWNFLCLFSIGTLATGHTGRSKESIASGTCRKQTPCTSFRGRRLKVRSLWWAKHKIGFGGVIISTNIRAQSPRFCQVRFVSYLRNAPFRWRGRLCRRHWIQPSGRSKSSINGVRGTTCSDTWVVRHIKISYASYKITSSKHSLSHQAALWARLTRAPVSWVQGRRRQIHLLAIDPPPRRFQMIPRNRPSLGIAPPRLQLEHKNANLYIKRSTSQRPPSSPFGFTYTMTQL